MKEPVELRLSNPERRLFPPAPPICSFCGGIGSEDDPLVSSTWGLHFVSRPFSAHRGCAGEYLHEQITEQEMREQLQ